MLKVWHISGFEGIKKRSIADFKGINLNEESGILKQVTTKKINLNAYYIDYSKAFDSVPHD